MRRRHKSTYAKYARKEKFYRNRPLIFSVAALVLLIIAGTVAYIVTNMRDKEEIPYEEMASASLPTISMTYRDQQVNYLHGYTQEMDIKYVRGTIYLLEDTYDIPLQINVYESPIDNISFKVFDPETGNLIQNTAVDEFSQAAGIASCTLRIDNLIEETRDYVLEITLNGASKPVNYYTRIRRQASTTLAKQMELVLRFNSCLYHMEDQESKDFLIQYMATDYGMDDNTSFGIASLNSSLTNMTWGSMKMKPLGTPEIDILEEDGKIGYFRLRYRISRETNVCTEYYNVSEYYRVRYSDDLAQVLNYERETNQIFLPPDSAIATKSAALGVLSNTEFEMMCSHSAQYNCFVAGNTLWSMDVKSKTLRRIFSFSTGIDDEKGNYDQHDIRIVRVKDEGDVQFLVYGYMNAGLHEGKVGISMFTYHADTEEVVEEIFIPTNMPYEILKNFVGELWYLGANNLYILIGEFLYQVNLEENRATMVTDRLNPENYMVYTSGRLIAWQEDGKINDADVIHVLDMETDEQYTVRAEEGRCIKVLGFLRQNLVYGQGREGNIYTDGSGKEYLLMTDMYVVNSEGQIETQNRSGSGYYIDSTGEYNRVIIDRITRSGDTWKKAEDFTIFATELEDYPAMQTYTQYEEMRKTVYYVEFADSTTVAGDLTIAEGVEAFFSDENNISIQDLTVSDDKYFVYAKGRVEAIMENAAQAIQKAYDDSGVVLSGDGSLFYKRGLLPSASELSKVALEGAREKANAGEMINVTGITLTEALYYIGTKIPLAWEYEGSLYIIRGYDLMDNFTLIDVKTGEERTLLYSYLDGIFEESGHCYVVQ